MSEHIKRTIADLQAKLARQEQEVDQTKRLINLLCGEAGIDPMYRLSEIGTDSLFSIRSDQFYGRPLATVMKEYLRMHRAANKGAATVNEVFQALLRGGYRFHAKNEDNAKRGIQISLSKNQDFHRIPSGSWGLSEWYPNAKHRNGKPPALDEDPDDKPAVETPVDLGPACA